VSLIQAESQVRLDIISRSSYQF